MATMHSTRNAVPTARGATREMTLEARYTPVRGAEPDRRIALTLMASLNRRDFGMTQRNPVLRVADGLTVTLSIEATRV